MKLPRGKGRLQFAPIKASEYTITPARYASGKVVIHCPSPDAFKTRAARLAEHVGGRCVGRSKGYTCSPAQAERFMRLYAEGRDASPTTGKLYD